MNNKYKKFHRYWENDFYQFYGNLTKEEQNELDHLYVYIMAKEDSQDTIDELKEEVEELNQRLIELQDIHDDLVLELKEERKYED